MLRRLFALGCLAVLLAPPLTAQAPVPVKLTTEVKTLDVHANIVDAIKITATRGGVPVPNLTINASVRDGDASVYSGAVIGPSVPVVTDAAGVATVSIMTNESEKVVIQLTPTDPADATLQLVDSIEIVPLTVTPPFVTSLGSKRSYVQLFLGQTFTNNYDKTTRKNTGFGNGGPIIRLTFDTMWRWQPQDAIAANSSTTTTPEPETPLSNSLRHGLFHTDANLEFSKFPFGPDAQTIGTENQKGLDDAFSGSLGLTWQPNGFASYDARDQGDLTEKFDNQPYDAYRFAIFSKAGVTTRSSVEEASRNNSINRIQVGLRFTHGRSSRSGPIGEDRNEVPIRFVEASVAKFSEWGGKKEQTTRLVIDAGLRITALSNLVFPVYVGTHLNTGPGPDDLRVFLGMLIKLDMLGKLVQGVTQ